MVNKTTSRTLLDGILRITTEKFIVLCNLSADSTPPSTPTYLEPDHTVPDLDISINTQDILTSLEQNPDPLNLLPISTNHQTFDSFTLPAAPPTSLLHLPTSFNRKKKRSSQTKVYSIHQNYTRVLELVKRGNPVADAIKGTGVAFNQYQSLSSSGPHVCAGETELETGEMPQRGWSDSPTPHEPATQSPHGEWTRRRRGTRGGPTGTEGPKRRRRQDRQREEEAQARGAPPRAGAQGGEERRRRAQRGQESTDPQHDPAHQTTRK
ncbi:hypothetical protein ACHWQZ_G016517 [Mnemiopsis leidyi]